MECLLVTAGLTIKLNNTFRGTFIYILNDELNKLEHKNNDKTKDIGEMDEIHESEDNIQEN